jgi:hypothetical protein
MVPPQASMSRHVAPTSPRVDSSNRRILRALPDPDQRPTAAPVSIVVGRIGRATAVTFRGSSSSASPLVGSSRSCQRRRRSCRRSSPARRTCPHRRGSNRRTRRGGRRGPRRAGRPTPRERRDHRQREDDRPSLHRPRPRERQRRRGCEHALEKGDTTSQRCPPRKPPLAGALVVLIHERLAHVRDRGPCGASQSHHGPQRLTTRRPACGLRRGRHLLVDKRVQFDAQARLGHARGDRAEPRSILVAQRDGKRPSGGSARLAVRRRALDEGPELLVGRQDSQTSRAAGGRTTWGSTS